MSRPAPRRADRRPHPAAAGGRVLAAAFAVALWLFGALGTTAQAAGAPGFAPAQAIVAAMPASGADEAAARAAADLGDLLAALDPDAAADAVALYYADVVPASPAESPPEAVQRELRDDVERLVSLCRERAPSPLPGASCDLPVPAIDPPQAGPLPSGPLAGLGWSGLRLRPGAPPEPSGIERAPLRRPPRV